MSYDIYLKDPKTGEKFDIESKHHVLNHLKGGTYCIGGTKYAELNITYNYSKFFYEHMGENGIREIYGKTGAESIPILRKAIEELGDDVDPDYWKATEGNAKRALQHLVTLAEMAPDGVWDGD